MSKIEKTDRIIGTVSAIRLNVRAKANLTADVLTIITKGETVTIAPSSKNNSKWYKITTASGVNGYCMKDYILVK